jgi:hypothetical protein
MPAMPAPAPKPPQVLVRAYAGPTKPLASSLALHATWLDSRPINTQISAWPHERDASHLQVLSGAPPGALLDSPEGILQRIVALRAEIASDPNRWNETCVALRRVQTIKRQGTPVINLGFALSEYAATRVLYQAFVSSGAIRFLATPKMLAWATSSFGVNTSIITSDNQVLLAVRGHATDDGRGLFHCAMNEGMSAIDIDSLGNPDPMIAIFRGLQEELGLDHDLGVTTIQSLFVTHANQWAISACTDLRATRWTSQKIRAAHLDAADHLEADLWFVDHSATAIAQALSQGQWIPHGALTVALAAISSLGAQAASLLLPTLAPYTSLPNLRSTGVLRETP